MTQRDDPSLPQRHPRPREPAVARRIALRSRVFAALAVPAVAVLVAACGGSSSSSGSSSTVAATSQGSQPAAQTGGGTGGSGNPITIGIIADITGSTKTIGDQFINGSEAAAKVFGPVNGRPVKFIVEDGGGCRQTDRSCSRGTRRRRERACAGGG